MDSGAVVMWGVARGVLCVGGLRDGELRGRGGKVYLIRPNLNEALRNDL